MLKDHEEQLQRLKRLKDQEIDAVTSATSHTRYRQTAHCVPCPAATSLGSGTSRRCPSPWQRYAARPTGVTYPLALVCRSLNGVIEQMERFSSDLHSLSHKVEATHHTTSQELAMGARQRDEQLKGTSALHLLTGL